MSIVGSYTSEDKGVSCYHNNLAILENILSHTIDLESFMVVDMVAGNDIFAGSLYLQFDLLVLVLEPTSKSIQVYNQYLEISNKSDIWNNLYVIGNKIDTKSDNDYITNNIQKDKYLGGIKISKHLKNVEKGLETIDLDRVIRDNSKVFKNLLKTINSLEISFNSRLKMLKKLHQKYINLPHIKERFGDLSYQIDNNFDFDRYIKNIICL